MPILELSLNNLVKSFTILTFLPNWGSKVHNSFKDLHCMLNLSFQWVFSTEILPTKSVNIKLYENKGTNVCSYKYLRCV